MSEFKVEIVEIKEVIAHPNADTLSIAEILGNPVIIRTSELKTGDLAIYIPVDGVCPSNDDRFAFLGIKRRIKAKKLRGVFSMGLLMPVGLFFDHRSRLTVGQDVTADLKIIKYEEPEPTFMNTGNIRDPGFMPVYNVEDYRRNKHDFLPGEEVVITEKLHGCNARFCLKDGQLWVGSHRMVKQEDVTNLWWKIAKDEDILEKLSHYPEYVLYGEVIGTQDLKYGLTSGKKSFAAFDLYNLETRKFVDYDRFKVICEMRNIPMVPVLYRGPFDPAVIEPLALGQCMRGSHIKEGIVIKPTVERLTYRGNRINYKLVGEQYLLRSGGTELH